MSFLKNFANTFIKDDCCESTGEAGTDNFLAAVAFSTGTGSIMRFTLDDGTIINLDAARLANQFHSVADIAGRNAISSPRQGSVAYINDANGSGNAGLSWYENGAWQVPVLLGGTSIVHYSLAAGVGVPASEIYATGLGITITKNATLGEITVAIPENVDPKYLVINLANTDAEDGTNHIYLKLDYDTARDFNTALANVNMPNIFLMPTNASPSRSTPLNVVRGGGNANDKQYGVSAIAGGDGSDLEIKITNAPVATAFQLHIDFNNI